MNFTYVNPTVVHFGQGQISAIATAIPANSKVLVIYGGGSIKRNGVYEQVSAALGDHKWLEFSGVEPNPTRETLDKAVAIVKEQSVDFILAVGGGSVIDGSKFVAAASKYDGDSWDIMSEGHCVTEATPLGAILTLPATGSESNSGAVITYAAEQSKLCFMSSAVQPKFAVLDPDVIKSLPEHQVINGVVDAWVHICEQYITYPTGNMVQEGYAETLLKNLLVLGQQFEKRDCDHWRANLMWTANQALNGMLGSGVPHDWATHMIGHEITAIWNVDHARSLAIVQPSLLRNQIDVKRSKLEQMGRNVFGLAESDELASQTIDAIEHFYRSLGVETTFSAAEMGKQQAVEAIVSKLEKHNMTALGEHEAINLDVSRCILDNAFI
ncbi:iron-containing alcohol dehydrogenase [Enterovibrio nigricans]|uniref:NADP-dependent alcohol dehydrogenase n=1 Tax=Enterovibrio nigricans DSM 22720 TaxID=1121868 RepID=A0A1T4U1A1_9GAMM|nr:iron-containing alcohol dehydrogenase [Enterovibrio nigricans]PKF49676.1 NADH-dependent alcohol dehydrogenase [Enterovibrio nigricans]SKA46311.1 NADP-dependent alcohol dehydrogenase [Enterovibrio nigricans DSM 22720]